MGVLIRRITLCVATVAITACVDATDPSLPPPADLARLQFIVDSTVIAAGVPGAVVGLITADGTRYVITSGVSDVSTGTPMSSTNRFRVGSITKSMVATVVLQLVDEGRLKLTDTISKSLPGVVQNADRITIRQLLNHTSGVPDYLDDAAIESAVIANPSRTFSFDELIAGANRQTPPFQPGSANWKYSNSNYLVLSALIEKVTGLSLGAQLKARVFDRLNMNATLYPAGPAIPTPFARGYVASAGEADLDVTTLISPSIAGGAGAVISNVPDLLIWADALAKGTLVSESSHSQQLDPVVASGTEGYGLGVQTFSKWVGHSGEIPGYEASAYSRPGVGTIVVLVNKSPTTTSTSYAIFDNVRWAEFGTR